MKTLLLFLLASPALAAPRIDVLSAKPNAKSPEVEFTLAVTKSGGNCDVRLDFGDGSGRTVDFGMATTRTLRYTYRKGGDFRVSAKGTGKTPCEGAREVPVKVAGAPAEKKKAEKKKAEKKKADKKSALKKKEEPK
jgi:hypothetical protein